jgi:isopenicillin-N N-acyltransferase-like protein
MAVSFLHVQAKGTYREIGRAVGEAARPLIAEAIAFYEEHFVGMAGIAFDEAERQALQYLPHARRWLPQYVEELEGMAEGAGLPFVKLLVPNCAEEFTCSTDPGADGSPHGGPAAGAAPACTAVAVMTADRHLVGHNMDWYVVDVDKNVLFDVTFPSGERMLTISGVPYLPILGMNSHGLGYVGNSLYSNDNRVGVPNAFVRRWVLEASSIDEACARATMAARARGSNHTLGDADGRILDVETSAGAHALIESHEWMAHTNHYVSPDMAAYEGYEEQESRTRLTAAETVLAAGMARGEDPFALVTHVLRDHSTRPDSICGHEDLSRPVAERSVTVASMVCDLDEGRLYACAGTPCDNPYQVFDL